MIPFSRYAASSSPELQAQSLTWSWSQAKDSSITLQNVEARCFAGNEGFDSVSGDSRRFPDSGWVSVDVPDGGFGQALVGITGEIGVGEKGEYTCEWRYLAEKDSGDSVTVEGAGSGYEIKPGDLSQYGTVGEFNLEGLCPSDSGQELEDGEVICSENIRLSTSPGSGHEMEEFASAVSIN